MGIYFRIFLIMFPIQIGLAAAYFLITGLRGIITQRPFLLSLRWLLALMFLGFLPFILLAFFFALPDADHTEMDLMDWLNPATFTVILVIACFTLKGYEAYGITDTSFREALRAALEKLQLSYEETLPIMRLTSIDADLQVSIQPWLGAGTIKIKQRKQRYLLIEIVRAMNEHFSISSAPTNLTSCIFSVVIGVLMAIGGIMIVFSLPEIL